MNVSLGLRDWSNAEVVTGALGALGLAPEGAARRVQAWFEQTFRRPAHLLDSGSTALQLALQCLAERHPQRRQVVLPALACPAVTRATLACGLQPVYADIGDDLNTPVAAVQDVLGPQTLALVMIHAYGYRADVEGLTTLCDRHDVALIDDAAQRVDPNGVLGTAGDFGILSFAQSKSVVTGIDGSGGVLLVNRAADAAWISTQVTALPRRTGRALPWLEFAATGRFPRLAYTVGRLRSRWPRVPRRAARIALLDVAIAEHQLRSLPRRMERRCRQLDWYRQALAPLHIEAPQLPNAGPPPFLARLMIRLQPDVRQMVRHALGLSGISSRLPYRLVDGVDPQSCPRASCQAAALLELPLPADLTPHQVGQVAAALAPFASPSLRS